MLYPLFFHPIFKERIWGGRMLAQLYKKALPEGRVIGESWEIVDREDENSVVANGPLAGTTLRQLMEKHERELLGEAKALDGRFPLLIKILDARETLSVQVHPPASKARELGGDPKTEMWFIADATPGAEIFAGLRKGVSRELFESSLRKGEVQNCIHRIPVKAGDAMFLPSGRVHALGGGTVIFEVQQNSDTTYRVFDWNRVDAATGRPRELHVEKSLASIDFDDFEPNLLGTNSQTKDGCTIRPLVSNELFQVELVELQSGGRAVFEGPAMRIFNVIEGAMRIESHEGIWGAPAGSACLVPARTSRVVLTATGPAQILKTVPGPG